MRVRGCCSALVLQPWLEESTVVALLAASLLPALMTEPCHQLAMGSSQLFQAELFRKLAASSPLLFLLQGALTPAKAASLFLSVHHPTPGVLTSGSSYAQTPCSDMLVCTLSVLLLLLLLLLLLSFRCSAYCCFKERDLRMCLTPPCFRKVGSCILIHSATLSFS